MMRLSIQVIRSYYRDGSAMFFGLIFPIVLVGCLGNMLADMDNPDYSIGAVRVGYYAQAGENAEQATAAFTEALGQMDGIELTKETSGDAAKLDVFRKNTDVAMVFGDDQGIKVYEGGDKIKNRTIAMIAKSFARESAAYTVAYAAAYAGGPERAQELTQRLTGRSEERGALTADKEYGGRTQSMIDFYAVTILVMICFMGGGIGGASDMYFARKEGILRRIAASPKRGGAVFIELVIGFIPGNIAQALAVMIPATLLLGARYAAAPADNILIFALFTLLGTTVSAVFMLIGLFMKVNPYVPLMAVLWTMLFISGSFNREITIPGVSEYLPMSIVNRAVFDLTMFGRHGQALTLMAVLSVILAASCAVGSRIMKRKETAL